jgi:DNA-binding Lrp family transcriptional regulator
MHAITIDGFDLKLLDALQVEGNLTNAELAERVGLSASQCSRRRSALESSGLILRYRAELSAEAVGLDVLVFVEVMLATHSPDNAEKFRTLVSRIDEVQEAYAVTGGSDYLIKLAVPNLKVLARILNEVFLPHEAVAHVRSSVVLDRLKQTSRLPLAHLSIEPRR